MGGLLFAGVLMFLCRLGSRRQIGCLLRDFHAPKNFEALFNVQAFPHGDTLDKTFRRLDPDQVQEAVSAMTESLIRKKALYFYRLLDKYFVIAVDGTGQLTFSKRHCPHCLTRTHSNGKTTYYHTVLEAKLVCSNGLALSMMSEFIENPGENPTKQDCELKAFYRLAERLKNRFPKLPICLSLDGLFAGGPVFELCRKYGWEFMIVLKDKDLPSVNEEFEALSKIQTENRLRLVTGKDRGIKQDYRWSDDIAYVDTEKRGHVLSVIECLETKMVKGVEKTTKFKWISSLKVKASRVVALAERGGRDRWKIENEGFNVQKNGGYGLEHAYSSNLNSSKIFYYLLQIAHALAQLMEKGSLLKKAFPKGFGSSKNFALCLLESWRNAKISKEEFERIKGEKYQIRFDTS